MAIESVTEAYHKWYYEQNTFLKTRFLGVPCMKSVSDMWNYQEILMELKPAMVIEFGTFKGGSALFFSIIGRQISDSFKVLTVDINHSKVFPQAKADADIEFMTCSSIAPEVAVRITALREKHPGSVFAILDSDHSRAHVLAELLLLRNLLKKGDYLVVEDTNINGHPVQPEWGEGPMEALLEYERLYPDDYQHDSRREHKFGFTFAPYGFLIRNQ